jgi:predicted anti-sigma-YlaC factor YlaD
VKQHSDIRSLFLPWLEQKLNQQLAQEIEEHLRGCDSCKKYFETISAALLPGAALQGGLVPDPYVPTRIRSHAREAALVTSSGKAVLVRWSLRTVAFAGAVVLGIYMGEELSYQPSVVTDQHIISEYSNYLGESGIGDRWQTVALTSEVVSK